jgi:hypothetical protein
MTFYSIILSEKPIEYIINKLGFTDQVQSSNMIANMTVRDGVITLFQMLNDLEKTCGDLEDEFTQLKLHIIPNIYIIIKRDDGVMNYSFQELCKDFKLGVAYKKFYENFHENYNNIINMYYFIRTLAAQYNNQSCDYDVEKVKYDRIQNLCIKLGCI